jgi:hypothetical protein
MLPAAGLAPGIVTLRTPARPRRRRGLLDLIDDALLSHALGADPALRAI